MARSLPNFCASFLAQLKRMRLRSRDRGAISIAMPLGTMRGVIGKDRGQRPYGARKPAMAAVVASAFSHSPPHPKPRTGANGISRTKGLARVCKERKPSRQITALARLS